MTAADDIRAFLEAAPPVADGFGRVVMLGRSAQISVDVAMKAEAFDGDYDAYFGMIVRTDVYDFKGWEVCDIGPEGRFIPVELEREAS